MNKRERELMEMMQRSCFYHTLKEHIHSFLESYKRLKFLESQLKIPPLTNNRYKMELNYFYLIYFRIRAYQNLYSFCKKDRKFRKNKPEWFK